MTSYFPDWRESGVRTVRHNQLDASTPQTSGMHRQAAVSRASVGAERIWAVRFTGHYLGRLTQAPDLIGDETIGGRRGRPHKTGEQQDSVADGLRVKYAFESIAAGFLSGHVELVAPTGSCVIHGAGELPRLQSDLCEEEGD